MLERKNQTLAPVSLFVKRLAIYISIAGALVFIALFIGMAGYHWVAELAWIDALLNASMILGGMGQVNTLTSDGAKLFASAYALFSGLVFIAVMGIVFSPIIHRILHKFHVDETDLKK
ncbi:MAG: hypothetical protein MPW14_20165 [Candidatus Manganitrophus sp.]|nr:hypothetical protein [Candidatus Manganitrophus sp.]MDC4225607.1 hypothetical protein [Candidatus Manganitrophus sp.]WDT73040.1 MAG: hypothetical protein MPW17_09430 [Candidatus Manganitrophus sp.]WDT74749.1 MAG: hypothetical protein MPW16_15975 [Candidatus Manganitrophus sp.]WDT79430.1 MAG: hypothetical protein MPW14_20165 [Candidatus Manganitrophus sp.]